MTLPAPDVAVFLGQSIGDKVQIWVFRRNAKSEWNRQFSDLDWISRRNATDDPAKAAPSSLEASVDIREVTRRQVFIEGKPVGDPFQ